MGAGQSSGQREGGDAPLKTSYYVLLGVEKTASDDEIKKAYHRRALELHPDRNYGKEEDATRLFAEIQAAYEVLSDPQERAWYDSHETAILSGGGDGEDGVEEHFQYNTNITTADDIAVLMVKFHGKKKSGIQNVPPGFFDDLRDFFEKLADEEETASSMEGTEIREYPSFGHKEDSYEDVVRQFYGVWSGFATNKTYFWRDKYKYSEAPDRRVRRMMEKENKRLRDEAVREFNEAVRDLVTFVRKRDPRYKPNFETDEQRQKILREAAAAQSARSRAAKEAVLNEHVPEWTKVRDPKEEEESEEGEIEEEHFECVACRKTFKSEGQFEAHEKSKKHRKAVESLKRKMKKENDNLGLGEGDDEDDDDDDDDDDNDNDDYDLDDLDDDADADTELEQQHSDDAAIVMKKLAVDDDDSSKEIDTPGETGASKDDAGEALSTDDEAGGDSGDREKEHPAGVNESDPDETPSTSTPKVGKAAQKRAKKAAKQAVAESEELKFKCARCNAAFPSRTRLFQHISDFDHAAPTSQMGKSGGGKRKGKR